MRRRLSYLVLLLGLAGCTSEPERDPVLGTAYVGPASLQIREELVARANLVATVKHGEKLELIGRRRRFYRVRVAAGAEGWVDGRQLLTPEGMEYLKGLAERASAAPTQGRATVFETLNVHTQPNRQAPSFLRLTHDAQVDVIAHELAPRVPFDPPEFIAASPVAQVRRKAKKPKAVPSVPLPSAPAAPAPPKNWLELSRNPAGVIRVRPAEPAPAPAKEAVPVDSWALIRAKDGRAGWVLSRMLLMAIPDEIAQHAERAYIVAYFQIGQIADRGEAKPVWLWATLTKPGVAHEFDSLRIFVWNSRRRRYETSYVERNMKGWLPIQVREGGSFSVVVEEKDGRLMERSYSVNNFRARVVSRQAAQLPETWTPVGAASTRRPDGAGSGSSDPRWQDQAKGLIEELKSKLKR